MLGKLGLAMAPVSGFATLVWPPAGISLAALVIGGYRLWPGIAVGALATNLWTGAPPLAACGIAASSTLEAVAGAFALRSIPGFRGSLDRFTEVIRLAVLAGVVSTNIGATVGVASLALSGVVSPANFARTWIAWWTGDLIGVLIVAPVLLTWARGPRVAVRPAALAEAAALGAFLVAYAAFLFVQRPEAVAETPILQPYVLFFPLLWAAFRYGTRGAATSMLVVAVAGVWGTYTGHGAFVRADRIESLHALQVFLASASLASLALGSVVSERERAQKDLRQNESLLRTIIDGTTDAIYLKDQLGRYVMVNAASARNLGVSAEAAIGKDDAALLPAAEANVLRKMDQEVMRTGQPRTTEESMTTAGTTHVYHTTKAPYRDHAGTVLGVIGISRDITERKSEEMARNRLAAIVDSSAEAVISKTLDGTITSWNAAAQRMYGYSPEEAIGQPISMLVPPERRDELAGFFDRILRGERIENHETVRCRKDGTRIDAALTMSMIHDSTGAGIGISTMVRDITERKRVEKALRESEERLRLAVEAANVGVWAWEPNNDLLVWTPLCRSMHGISQDEEVRYARLMARLHPDDRERSERAIRRSLEEHADYQIEHRVVWPDGSIHWISVLGRAFYDQAGEPERMLGVSIDITAQKRAEQEHAELLERERAARAEAQAATRAKDEFLAVLSHELRTPLQSMVGWTRLLKERHIDERMVQKGLDTIERNVNTQAQLIEDLLDVSRIVLGKLRLERKRVDLAKIVASALESAKVAADAKSIRVDATIDPVAGDVLGDPDRLQQVISNLLSNAVKFTPTRGRIGVRLEREGTTARIIVEDTGRGISPEFLPHVFDRFRQAESTTMRSQGGLGLGLAIVRHLVELHGGTVKAESLGENRGATFTVTLRLISGERRAVAAERRRTPRDGSSAPVVLDGVRVLVVDDDRDTCELLETVLRGWGAYVRSVPSARAALDELASFSPHLLMSDIGMPEVDGYALIRNVRTRESAEGGHVPALALTAFASQADREQALASGFDAHIAKPASPGDLVTTVAGLVGRAA
jgi:PAS domain S-box-containing protein